MNAAPTPEDKRQLLLSDSRIRTASTNLEEVKLCSGIKPLDEFLHGGLPFSSLIEWGIPFGNGGRRLMASFLARATTGRWESPQDGGLARGQRLWCLWISARPQLALYPPAWRAAGVDLRHLRFVRNGSPVRDLKSLFIDPFFRVVVIDNPTELSTGDCCFLAHQARKNNQLIVILRDQLLSPFATSDSNSNVWARLRFNTWRNPISGAFEMEFVRGGKANQRTAFLN